VDLIQFLLKVEIGAGKGIIWTYKYYKRDTEKRKILNKKMSTIKKIDAISVPAVENSLALFDLPPSIVSYNKTYQKELLPLNTITRDGPYTFRLYSDSNFINLSRTYMQLKISIEKKSGGDWVPIADENDDDKNTSAGLADVLFLKICPLFEVPYL
jgi:hypothetical protein